MGVGTYKWRRWKGDQAPESLRLMNFWLEYYYQQIFFVERSTLNSHFTGVFKVIKRIIFKGIGFQMDTLKG